TESRIAWPQTCLPSVVRRFATAVPVKPLRKLTAASLESARRPASLVPMRHRNRSPVGNATQLARGWRPRICLLRRTGRTHWGRTARSPAIQLLLPLALPPSPWRPAVRVSATERLLWLLAGGFQRRLPLPGTRREPLSSLRLQFLVPVFEPYR